MSTFRVMQDGMQVARVDCDVRDRALNDALHYAMMYSQDGDVLIEEKVGRHWKAYARMEFMP